MATGGSARGADGARRRCPPQAQKDGRNVPKNPVTKTVVAVGLGRGAYAGSANKSKPDGNPASHRAKRRAKRRSQLHPPCASDDDATQGQLKKLPSTPQGTPFKVRANGLLAGTRLPRFVGWGEATALARGVNRAMTRSSLSDAPRRAHGLATSAVLDY